MSSICMLLAAISALIVSNTSLNNWYNQFIHLDFSIGFPNFHLSKSVLHWINDGLMTIFFFVIGLEIKREFLLGELSSMRKAMLPIFAAIGGMIFPIALFFILNHGREGIEGWGITMATDIAFTLGVLGILGKRVPFGLTIFLAAFAIIDDLGAVLVIAIFYSSQIHWHLVAISVGLLMGLSLLSFKNIYSRYLYIPVGIVTWLLFLESGIHPTIAGVLFAFTIPSHRKKQLIVVINKGKKALNQLSQLVGKKVVEFKDHKTAINILDNITSEIQSPLQHLENKLGTLVSFLIIPLFAFANSGINFTDNEGTFTRLSISIAVSLIFGKIIGISLFTWLAVRFKLAVLPENVNFKQIIGLACLGGFGFTMSIFISQLSYESLHLQNSAKLGILIASVIAGISGYLIIRYSIRKSVPPEKPTQN
ncbi:Na+/H+ antiporter NhaA [Draconibacterium halophilum]|uniref:Na(+)/H(+) antiporter NhaA n=1 Tax=Draconibacterium halophilum TaxID=2706887 RepID=A0A6C0RDA5_9BACT|nr:Na+/H+ antiporter NhaA [Draconibacterium halophilum]